MRSEKFSKTPLLISLFLAMILAASTSFAMTPEQGLKSLQPQEVIFEAWFENNLTLESFSEIPNLNKKQQKLISGYKIFLQKKKRQTANKNFQKAALNSNFFGNPNHTSTASDEDLKRYELILNSLAELKEKAAINDDTFSVAQHQLIALQVWHQNNPAIARELNNSASSPAGPNSLTYKKAYNQYLPTTTPPSLHIEKNALGIPFEDKPNFLLSSLWEAFAFATEHKVTIDFFEALTGVSGCLEAHCGAASDWYHKSRERLTTGKNLVSGTEAIRNMLRNEALAQNFYDEEIEEKTLRLTKIYFGTTNIKQNQYDFVKAIIFEAEGDNVTLLATPDGSDNESEGES